MERLLRNSIAWLFGYRQVPFASRGIFRQELFHILCWGVLWGSLNGGFCGYVARRSFDASALLVSVIAAAMAFANLFAVWWAAATRRFSKRAVMTVVFSMMAVLLLSIALTPYCDIVGGDDVPRWLARWTSNTHPLTAVIFTVQIALIWVGIQATNTIRTTIWKTNYPDSHRGRVLARFAIWQILVGSVWGACIGAYLDGALRITSPQGATLWAVDLSWIPGGGAVHAYAVMLPLSAIAVILAAVFFARMHIRGEHETTLLQPLDRSGTEVLDPNYATPGWFSTRWGVLLAGFHDSKRILVKDRRFREYMGWLFLSGSAVLMVHVPFVLILQDIFDLDYLQAAGVLTILPQVTLILLTPLWSRLFDRWSLFKFRSVQIGIWTIGRAVLAAGVGQRSMSLILLAVTLSGAGLAGGRFAWQIGHMNFSNQGNDSTYLGIHQTLTGIRGLVMPFVGAALYKYVLDWHLIWMSAVLLLISTAGYWKMHRDEVRQSTS